ncbi:MAG: hypothetical protein EDM75_04395 [Chlorobiota bacterium]|nr:MAG: hypothetical protein EDM75_04395 [Chlorobiota bacterium]
MKIKSILLLLFFVPVGLLAQVENVNIDDPVYSFLKRMKVKGVIESIHDDVPNMSRQEINDFLDIIRSKQYKLTATERERLEWFTIQFSGRTRGDGVTNLLGGSDFGQNLGDIVSDKIKYLYS